jgi:hypothetical protein
MPNEFEVHHPAGLSIGRALTEAAVSAAFAGEALQREDMGTGWIWIGLPPFRDGEVLVAVSLGFNQCRLEHISLTDADPRYGKSWDDWSEAQERLRGESIGRWLAGKGYPSGSYPWGTVWSGYDEKGAFGTASIRYAS